MDLESPNFKVYSKVCECYLASFSYSSFHWYGLGLAPNYVRLRLGNEAWVLITCKGHAQNLGVILKKLVVLTLKIHQIFNWGQFNYLCLCLAQRLIWTHVFYVNHIFICICNRFKWWFRHPYLTLTPTCVQSLNLCWSNIKKSYWRSNTPWYTYTYQKCLCANSLMEYTSSSNYVDCLV